MKYVNLKYSMEFEKEENKKNKNKIIDTLILNIIAIVFISSLAIVAAMSCFKIIEIVINFLFN